MLRDLKEKDNMKRYRGNVSRAGNSKNQKEMLEINTVTNEECLCGLFSR